MLLKNTDFVYKVLECSVYCRKSSSLLIESRELTATKHQIELGELMKARFKESSANHGNYKSYGDYFHC